MMPAAGKAEGPAGPGLRVISPDSAPVTVSAIVASTPIGKVFQRDAKGEVRAGIRLWYMDAAPVARSFTFPDAQAAISAMLAAPGSTMYLSGTWKPGREGAPVSPGPSGPTLGNLAFHSGPGLLVIDTDRKTVGHDCHALHQPFDFPEGPAALLSILREVAPELPRVVAFDSSSSFIETVEGKQVRGAGGLHALLGVADATQIPRFLRILHKRLVLAGYGWGFVAANGLIHVRSPVDLAFERATQPNFMSPHLGPGLRRNGVRSAASEGPDLLNDLAEPSEEQEREFAAAVRRIEGALSEPAHERRAAFQAEQGKRAQDRAGKTAGIAGAARRACTVVAAEGEGPSASPVVLGSLPITLKDGRDILAADLLTDRDAFNLMDCADPADPDYRGGKAVARIYTNPDDPAAGVFIHSHAHGSPVTFRVLFDAPTLERRLAGMADEDASTVPWCFRQSQLTAMEDGRLKKTAAAKFNTTIGRIDEDVHGGASQARGGGGFRALVQQFATDQGVTDGIERLRFWRGDFYRWTGAAWQRLDPVEVDRLIVEWLTARGDDCGPRTLDGFTRVLKTVVLADQGVEDGGWIGSGKAPGAPDELVPFPNGILHLPTRKLLACTPRLFNLSVRDFSFDDRARCPNWQRSVAEWFAGGEEADLLQEIVGYIVGGSNKLEKAFLLYGSPRSGKGTTVEVCKLLLGKAATTTLSPANFSDTHGLAHLPGKMLAVLGDVRQGRQTDIAATAQAILNITGNDVVGVRPMYRPVADHLLRCRILWVSNELPKFGDTTATIVTRFVILRYSRSFLGMEDPRVKAGVYQEAAGIFNWALAGLDRVVDRGRFTVPASSLEAAETLHDSASPIGAFANDHLQFAPDTATEKDTLYGVWKVWCAENGHHAGSRQHFMSALYAYAATAGHGFVRAARRGAAYGKRLFVVEGVRLDAPEEKTIDPLD